MIAAAVLALSLSAKADFAGDFQKARKSLDRRKYGGAAEAFATLAATAPNAHGRAWSLCYAAVALGRSKKYDQAIELAKEIESKPMATYAQMTVMSANRKHKELIAAFSKEKIATWPDAINYKGFFLRGIAHATLRDSQSAAKDFERCVDLSGSDTWTRLEALNKVAALYHALKDDAKAMDTYTKAFAIYDEDPSRKGRWLYPQALLGAARILMSQNDHDGALAMLAKFSESPPSKSRGSWDFLVLEAYADIFAAQGKPDDALAKYQDAVTIKTHKSYIDRVNKKIRALENDKKGKPK